jgi:hypothetical protein
MKIFVFAMGFIASCAFAGNPKCAGNPDLDKCEKFHAALNIETAGVKEERSKSLEKARNDAAIVVATNPASSMASCALKKEINGKAVDPLLGLTKTYDKMNGISWYKHGSSPKRANSNGLYLYFGRDEGGKLMPLRLVAQYFASDWLFVTRAWAKADGLTIDIPQKSKSLLGWERDNSGGNVWEWSDTSVSGEDQIEAVRQIAFAKNVTVRFEGKQYYVDRTIGVTQLKAMRDVISAYERTNGKCWN